MKTIATFGRPEQAHLLRSRLEGEGIAAFVRDEHLVQTNWLLSNAVGGVKVEVADEDGEAALAVLHAAQSPEIPVEAFACPRCASAEVEQYAFPRKMAYLSILFLGFPLLFSVRKLRCRACGQIWRSSTSQRS